MRLVVGFVRLIIAIGILGLSAMTVIALLGFAVPEFDLLNHFQLFLFFGTLLGVVLALGIYFGSRWRPWVLGVAVAGLVASSVTFVPEFIAGTMPKAAPPDDGRPTVRLMTHNLFGLNYDMERVSGVIAAENPDIIAFQEYFGEQSSDLHPLLDDLYPYSAQCRGGKRANIAIYSRLPFDEAQPDGACPNDAYGRQRTARILATFRLPDGAQFSVLTTHLDWPVPVMRQHLQFEELTAAVQETDGPLLVVGDFNSTPWSYAMRDFATRAMLERQTNNVVTFPLRFTAPHRLFPDGLMETLPVLPLDHVLTRAIAVHTVHAGADTGSDHLPIVVSFSVPGG